MGAERGVEEGGVLDDGGGGKVAEPGAQKARFGYLARVAIEVVGRDDRVARVGRLEEIPRQHLPFAALDEILRRVRHGEEGQLPAVVYIPRGRRRPGRLVPECGEHVFGEPDSFDQRWVFGC